MIIVGGSSLSSSLLPISISSSSSRSLLAGQASTAGMSHLSAQLPRLSAQPYSPYYHTTATLPYSTILTYTANTPPRSPMLTILHFCAQPNSSYTTMPTCLLLWIWIVDFRIICNETALPSLHCSAKKWRKAVQCKEMECTVVFSRVAWPGWRYA